MNAAANKSYEGFLMQLVSETDLLEAVVGSPGQPAGELSYRAWSQSLAVSAPRAPTPADIWTAGATAMFQALVERGYIGPRDVESALAATADVLTT
jgi:hypothetical protein